MAINDVISQACLKRANADAKAEGKLVAIREEGDELVLLVDYGIGGIKKFRYKAASVTPTKVGAPTSTVHPPKAEKPTRLPKAEKPAEGGK